MEATIRQLVTICEKAISQDLVWDYVNRERLTEIVLHAYNRVQEDEHDGADYIFDIFDSEDLCCCIKGGMSAKHIAEIYDKCNSDKTTQYFFFGQNYKEPKIIASKNELRDILTSNLREILLYMLTYPEVKEYNELYKELISAYITNNSLLP